MPHNIDDFIASFLGEEKEKQATRRPTPEELKRMQVQALLAVIEKKVDREETIDSEEFFKIDINAARVHPAVNVMLQFMNLPIITADWPTMIKERGWQITNLNPGTYRNDGTLKSIRINMRRKATVDLADTTLLIEDNMARFKRFYEAEIKKRKAAGTHV